MTAQLQAEIKQRKPFASLEEEALLNLLRTADVLTQGLEKVLKAYGLSPAQYNVLRILRGSGPGGRSCREVAERMLTRDPDITRLLDRLEARGLVTRTRERQDRRVITTRVTRLGLALLAKLDGPAAAWHRERLGRLGAKRLRALIELLQAVRVTSG
ncbi:MAG: MarR family transcriptional regulator [Acidobacteriia bacterium]|nr:MarR family transcriptional regulator [Terriglobia bacterium]